ncbi:Transposase [Stackebrandtia soli]
MRWGWVVVLGMFVLSVDEPQWIRVFSGLSPRQFDRLVSIVADRGGVRIADGRACRPWSLRLADRVLLVAVYLRTNLTHRQIAPLFGVDKSAVNRIIASLEPLLALETTPIADTAGKVFIVDGTVIPVHDATVADASKNYRRSANLQVMIDADTCLAIAVAGPLKGSRHDSHAYTESGIEAAAGTAAVMADGGYQGNDVIMPYRKPIGGQLKP